MSEIVCITCGKVLSDPLEMFGPNDFIQCQDCFLAGDDLFNETENSGDNTLWQLS